MNNDKEFMSSCKDANITIKNIHQSNLNTLDKIRFLKLVGKNFDKVRTPKEKYFNQKMSEKTEYIVDTIFGYFDKFSENSVIKAMIQIVGNESKGDSGNTLFEGFKIKKEPYQNVYIFNIIHEYGNIDMLNRNVEKEGHHSVIISTKGYPTKEQLACMVISPELIKKDSYTNDFGTFECFKIDFDCNDIYNFGAKKN